MKQVLTLRGSRHLKKCLCIYVLPGLQDEKVLRLIYSLLGPSLFTVSVKTICFPLGDKFKSLFPILYMLKSCLNYKHIFVCLFSPAETANGSCSLSPQHFAYLLSLFYNDITSYTRAGVVSGRGAVHIKNRGQISNKEEECSVIDWTMDSLRAKTPQNRPQGVISI